MSKQIQRAISVLLTIILAFSTFSVLSFAAEDDNTESAAASDIATTSNEATASIVQTTSNFAGTDDISATIIIPGISQSVSTYCDENGDPILNDDGEELSGGLLIIDDSNIVKMILKNLLIPLLFAILSQRVTSGLYSGVYDTICELFSIQKTDTQGNAVNNLVVDTYDYPLSEYDESDKSWFYRRLPMQPVVEQLSETYGVDAEEYIYLYTFPLIGDPMESAEGLDDFIDLVKSQTGCSKVNLVAVSLGGTIVSAYMDLTMENGGDFSDIDKVIGVVACYDGTDLFADFYARNWNLDDEFLYSEYLTTIMTESGSDEYVGHLLNIAIRILPKKVLYTILTAAMDGILDTLLLYNPQFWSMVPSDRYEELADYYFSDAEYSVIKAKTDRFQQARVNLDDNLVYANENYGTEVYTVSGYGRQYDTGDYCYFGITGSSSTSNSDSIIDVDSSSLGATYATAGETLGITGDYVSPEGEVDASTCTFSDTAWFFYGQHHEVGRDDVVIKLLAGIVCNEIKDVNSSESFPQYNFNRNTKNLTKSDGLIAKAEAVINNEDGEYTQDEIDSIMPAYENACALLEQTVLTASSDDEATEATNELRDALAGLGLESYTSTTGIFVKLLNVLTRGLDNLVMKIIGGQGFSDIFFG